MYGITFVNGTVFALEFVESTDLLIESNEKLRCLRKENYLFYKKNGTEEYSAKYMRNTYSISTVKTYFVII